MWSAETWYYTAIDDFPPFPYLHATNHTVDCQVFLQGLCSFCEMEPLILRPVVSLFLGIGIGGIGIGEIGFDIRSEMDICILIYFILYSFMLML